jgi:3-methyladenine DNA glycosylase AlkD
MMTNNLIAQIRQALIEKSDEKTRVGSQRFFKEPITVHGVKPATVKKISKEFFSEVKDKPKFEIFNLCELLWQSGFLEESFIACDWSDRLQKQFEPADFEVFEFVTQHKHAMPRIALRYAIEKMPPEMKKEAMTND